MPISRFAIFLGLLSLLVGCQAPQPRAVRIGEECAHCRMNLTEPRFAAQLLTHKGRSYVFDDMACLIAFLPEHPELAGSNSDLFVADMNHPAAWLPVAQAQFVHSPDYHTPMNGQMGAFATRDAAIAAQKALSQPGQLLTWSELSTSHAH